MAKTPPLREEPQKAGAGRTSQELQAAEELLARHSDGWTGPDAETRGLRSRRALEAYSALQESDERDYVAKILGVDEIV